MVLRLQGFTFPQLTRLHYTSYYLIIFFLLRRVKTSFLLFRLNRFVVFSRHVQVYKAFDNVCVTKNVSVTINLIPTSLLTQIIKIEITIDSSPYKRGMSGI